LFADHIQVEGTPILNVIVSLPTNDIGYHSLQSAAAETAARQLGIKLKLLYAGGDAIAQSEQLLTSILSARERPDAIILEPAGTALPAVAKEAVKAGVGWVVLNRDAEYIPVLRRVAKAPIFEVSTDHEEVGRIQGRQFGALLPEGGLVLYIEGPASSDAAVHRRAGMLSTKPATVEIKTLHGNWTIAGAQHAVESWLRLPTSQKLPVKAIGCQNDSMAMGARNAFLQVPVGEREKWLQLPFTGCDGLPEAGEAWVRKHVLAATVVIPANAGTALEMLAQAMQSGLQPAERTLMKPSLYPALEELRRWSYVPGAARA
jgi:ribose transport system substrate-binding protein